MTIVYGIFEKPLDYPNNFVVRRFVDAVPDQEPTAVVETLEEAREALPKDEGLIWMKPCRGDVTSLVETWL